MSLFYKKIQSPSGVLTLVATDKKLVAVLWPYEKPNRVKLGEMIEGKKHPVLEQAHHQLDEYFAGKRKKFDLPLEMRGTDFQVSVWKGLLKIPYGKTKSYGELAEQIGRAGASRAVGAANGRNPLSIVVPCHRVIGSTGKLVGFAGSLKTKDLLLTLEKS